MRTILILTVGGSHQPILTSIAINWPDFVYFLCSEDEDPRKSSRKQVEGAGLVLKSRRELQSADLPNIPTLANLPAEQYRVLGIITGAAGSTWGSSNAFSAPGRCCSMPSSATLRRATTPISGSGSASNCCWPR